jgi:undecaprenyl-diphosphatase
MDTLQAIVIAILQGATELFPVSSLGHAVLLPALLKWGMDQAAPAFLPFLVMLHVGTAVALLGYFWRDWLALFLGVIGVSGEHQNRESRRVTLLIIVATIPAVVVGFLLEHSLRILFATPLIAAAFLVVNGLLLLFGERLRAGSANRVLATLTIMDALVIGLWQCLALIPGISRSGATIVGGLLRGVNHEGSAHFSFLIATPIILGATVLEVPKLLHADIPAGTLQLSILAAVVAGITALLSTAFLMRYFRNNDSWALNPFAFYCLIVGLGSVAYLVLA